MLIIPKIEYSNIGFLEVPGFFSYLIYFQGCTIRCPDCQNDILLDFKDGKSIKIQEFLDKINEDMISCRNYIDFFVFLGGEPFDQMHSLLEIINFIKEKYPEKRICIYTGYKLEELYEKNKENDVFLDILDKIDIIKDGKYDKIDIFSKDMKNDKKIQRFLIKLPKNTEKTIENVNYNEYLIANHRFIDFYPSFTENIEDNKRFISKIMYFLYS